MLVETFGWSPMPAEKAVMMAIDEVEKAFNRINSSRNMSLLDFTRKEGLLYLESLNSSWAKYDRSYPFMHIP